MMTLREKMKVPPNPLESQKYLEMLSNNQSAPFSRSDWSRYFFGIQGGREGVDISISSLILGMIVTHPMQCFQSCLFAFTTADFEGDAQCVQLAARLLVRRRLPLPALQHGHRPRRLWQDGPPHTRCSQLFLLVTK